MYTKSIAKSLVLKREKEALKNIALSIRTAKRCLKDTFRQRSIINEGNHTKIIWGSLSPREFKRKIIYLKFEFRHRHIAYCLVRGRTYEQIENKTRSPANKDLISELKKKLEKDIYFRIAILFSEQKATRMSEEDRDSILGICKKGVLK